MNLRELIAKTEARLQALRIEIEVRHVLRGELEEMLVELRIAEDEQNRRRQQEDGKP